ncbi:MAG TPA: ATP-binding protein [Bdellovibrionota bacterium]|jgi:signal transduction histidine kinase|nr:ATP-binding protein [Bdellovibrionota bacterium]
MMDVLGQSSFLVAVTSLALGASVAARNLRNKVYLAFGTLCGLIFAWSLAFFLYEITGRGMYYRAHLFTHVWLSPAGIAMVRGMVRARDRFSRRLMHLSVAAAFALSGALLLGVDEIPWVHEAVLFSPGFVALQMLRLLWMDRGRGAARIPNVGLEPARRSLIYLGALLVLCTSFMDHAPELGRVVPALGNLGLTVYLFFVSQALTQQRLLNVEALISRFLVLLTLALLLTGVYSLLFTWIQSRPALFFLNSFIISFLLVVLLDPLRSLVRVLTQRFVPRRQRQLMASLRDAQMRLAIQNEPRSLFEAIILTVRQLLGPDRAALYVLSGDATRYEWVRSLAGAGRPVSGGLLPGHALLHVCEDLHRRGEVPVLLDQMLENELDRSASRTQREHLSGLLQAMKAIDANVLIPLFDEDRLLGFVTLAASAPPEPWGNNWGLLQLIYPFFEQAGRTLRNLEVFTRQREKERLAALGEMAAGLAHEIRNPLGAIKGAAQFLEPESDRPDARFLKVIVEETDRLNHVVSQFLEYSKPAGLDTERFDLAPLAEKAIDTLRHGLADPRLVRLEVQDRGAWVSGTPIQVQQLLVNLVQNAAKAVQSRPAPKVTVRVAKGAPGSPRARYVVLEVEDNGQGIPARHMDKIFIPFFTTSTGGTGLGLSICQKIAENHGGRIEAVSEEGRFARFTVLFPFAGEPKA